MAIDNSPGQQSLDIRYMEEGQTENRVTARICRLSFLPSVTFVQKVVAEFIGTFFLMFVGCGSIVVDKISNGSITHLGVSLVWGMAAMIVIYATGHISGAHLNPAVTLAFAAVRRFPWVHVPAYIVAQVFASISAGFILRFLFGEVEYMGATVPSGPEMQSFVFEIITTSLLMFVVSAMATDTKAVGELAGLAIGSTIAMNVAISGPISGGSMNPARTIGSAVPGNKYTSIWVYMAAPVIGALMGAMSYNMIRQTDKSVSVPFLKDMLSSRSSST